MHVAGDTLLRAASALFLFSNAWYPLAIWESEFSHPSAPRWRRRLVFRVFFSAPCQRRWVPCCVNEFCWIHCALGSAPCSRIGLFVWPFMKFEGAFEVQACLFAECQITDLPSLGRPEAFRDPPGIHRVVYMYTNMITIRFRMVPIIPSTAKILSSLLSFSWPPLSSSFPLVITILVANGFIFLPRLTCKWREAAQRIIIDTHPLCSQADLLGEGILCLGTRSQVGVKKYPGVQFGDMLLLPWRNGRAWLINFKDECADIGIKRLAQESSLGHPLYWACFSYFREAERNRGHWIAVKLKCALSHTIMNFTHTHILDHTQEACCPVLHVHKVYKLTITTLEQWEQKETRSPGVVLVTSHRADRLPPHTWWSPGTLYTTPHCTLHHTAHYTLRWLQCGQGWVELGEGDALRWRGWRGAEKSPMRNLHSL